MQAAMSKAPGLGLVGAGIALDEREPVGDAELAGARDGGTEEHRAEVDADARGPEPLGPAAEQLALAAREVEHPRARDRRPRPRPAAAASPR